MYCFKFLYDILLCYIYSFFIFCDFRFPCEVRVRSVPLTPCRRKKRKDEELESPRGAPTPVGKQQNQQFEQNIDTQVQSSQVRNGILFIVYIILFVNFQYIF